MFIHIHTLTCIAIVKSARPCGGSRSSVAQHPPELEPEVLPEGPTQPMPAGQKNSFSK